MKNNSKTLQTLLDCAVNSWRVSSALEASNLPPAEANLALEQSEKIKVALLAVEKNAHDESLHRLTLATTDWIAEHASKARAALLEEASGLAIPPRITLCSGQVFVAQWMHCLQSSETELDEALPFYAWPAYARKRTIEFGQKISEELEFGKSWSDNDHWLLQSRSRGLPAQLDVLAACLKAMDENTDLNTVLWEALETHAQEVTQWREAGFENAWAAAEWQGRAMTPHQALQWFEAGICGDEADLFLECGLDDVDEALQMRQRCGNIDSFRAWLRLGFTPNEITAWIAEGAHHPDQANSMRRGGRVPASLQEKPTVIPQEKSIEEKSIEEKSIEEKPTEESSLEKKELVLPETHSENNAPETDEPSKDEPKDTADPDEQDSPQETGPDLSGWYKVDISDDTEIKTWQDAGFENPADAATWRSQSLSPAHAAAWNVAGVSTPATAAWLEGNMALFFGVSLGEQNLDDWIRRCLSPWPDTAQAVFWWGLSVEEKDWQAAGLQSPHGGTWIRKISASGLHAEDLGISIIRKPQGGPVLITPAASVTAVPPGKGLHATRWDIRNAWIQDLSLVLQALGLSSSEPHWHLCALQAQNHSEQASLFFGAVYPGEGPPWVESMDYMPNESWRDRYKRRASDMGDEENPPPYEFQKDLAGDEPGWTLYAQDSRRQSPQDEPCPQVQSDPQWLEPFEDLCRIMDITLKKPAWTVALIKAATSE